jgi:HD-GYP domain-containing protein (c-di-GMP phosphodiesterase class II)
MNVESRTADTERSRQALQSFLVMHRTARTHAVNNDAMLVPLQGLVQAFNGVIDAQGLCEFYLSGTTCVVNGVVVVPELAQLPMVRDVTQDLKTKDIGGLRLPNRIDQDTARRITSAVVAGDHAAVADGRFELCRAGPIEALLRQLHAVEVASISARDPIERALQLFAALVGVIEKTIDDARAGRSQTRGLATSRVLREVVDVGATTPHILLMLGLLRDDRLAYLSRHLASTAMLSVLVGLELRLPRSALLQVAQIALYHEMGVAVYGAHLEAAGRELSDADRQLIADLPLLSARMFLRRKILDEEVLKAVLATVESKRPADEPLGQNAAGTSGAGSTMLLARIVQACSTFDALTSDRPFRAAMPVSNALLQMRDGPMRIDARVMAGLALVVSEPGRLVGRALRRDGSRRER